MKKVLFSLFLLASLLGQAQTNPALPLPSEAKWVYFNGPTHMFWKDEFPSATIINDTTIHYYFEGLETGCLGMNFCEGCSIWYPKDITQEGNKWYFMNELYFDWDTQEGDTIHFMGCNLGGDDFIVNNIDTITTADFVQRRTYHLIYTFPTNFPVPFFNGEEFYFIEGIGATVFGLDIWSVDDRTNYLTCFYDKNGLLIFHSDFAELGVYDCCYMVGVKEESISSINLFPSPAKENVTIQFDGINLPSSIQIFDSVGQVVHSEAVNGRQQMTLNTESLATGVYVVRAADSSLTATFVKE